jgi:hypothetical protein
MLRHQFQGPIVDPLEPRVLLSGGGMPFTAYFPEGYSHGQISEFVPITNTNEFEVEYELHARYETGERDQILADGVIPAGMRSGVTINRADDPASMLVRPDTPYALELRASAPLAATISHYDFGTSIGESFTERTSREWTFGEGYKDHAWTRDFVVLYNPGESEVTAELTVYSDDGEGVTLEKTVGPGRRAGWNLDAEDGVPEGVFGMRVLASAEVVAALSHYEIVTERGFGVLGQSDGGATAGVITAIEYDDHGHHSGWDDTPGSDVDDDHGGDRDDDPDDDDSGDGNGGRGEDDDRSSDDGSGWQADSYITILNTGDSAASVTLSFLPADDDGAFVRRDVEIEVGARARGGLRVRDLGLPIDEEFGVVYTSDVPVTVTAAVYEGPDATGVEAATIAARRWEFGEGYMSLSRAGRTVTEEIYLFNPTGREIDVTVTFVFSTGRTLTATKSLDPLEIDDVRVHARDGIVISGDEAFYGVRVEASGFIVAAMEHWDDDLGGGFATLGMPRGEVVDLADVLAL